MLRRDFLKGAAGMPALLAQQIQTGDPVTEWKRSKPDIVVYLPKEGGLNDGDNEHFLVFESPKGDMLAMWTQSSVEAFGDNHIMLARSKDLMHWSEPAVVAGPYKGAKEPQASWGVPVVSRQGRIYCFFCQDSPGPERDSRDRTLKMNDMGVRYSDDDGHTWKRGADIPWPKAAYDHPTGKGTFWNWIIFQIPIRDSKGRPFTGYSYWVSDAWRRDNPPGWWVADSGCKFMRFDNLDQGPDPKDIRVTHLMLEGKGLTVPSALNPALTDCEEPSLVLLPDRRLFVTMRTITGYIWYSVSDDDGVTWRKPEMLRYRDGGDPIPHPKAPCPIYRLKDGRYLLLYFNNPGKLGRFSQFAPPAEWKGLNHWSHIRRPAHIAVGEFRPKARQPIWFSRPKQILDTDGVIVGPKKTAEIATYTSLTESKGKRVLWYPDRKYYLLGKILSDELLRGMEPEKA
jgi:hypothetical protein